MIVVTVRWEGSGGGRDCGRRQEGLRLTAVSGGQAGLAAQLDRLDTNEAFLERAGEARSEDASELEVVQWEEARDSTDQEERSSERGRCDFMVTRRSSVQTR